MYRDDVVRCINPFPWKYDYDHSLLSLLPSSVLCENERRNERMNGRNDLSSHHHPREHPQTRHDDKTFHFVSSVSRGGRIISSIIIFTTAFYMLIFRTYNASPGSLAGRQNVSSEMALSNDEYAICSVIPRDRHSSSNWEIRIYDLIIYGITERL